MGMGLGDDACIDTVWMDRVEFQNKFYHADGIPFEPFHYMKLAEED